MNRSLLGVSVAGILVATVATFLAGGCSAVNANRDDDAEAGGRGDPTATDAARGVDIAATPGAFTSEGGIIAVHAASDLPAVRFCFSGDDAGTRVPSPDTRIMPRSNVVGLDVGSAVHLGSLANTRAGAAAALAVDGGADGGVDASAGTDGGGAAPLNPNVFVFAEAAIRAYYPAGEEAKWPSCDVLVAAFQRQNLERVSMWPLALSDGEANRLMSPGLGHLLILSGSPLVAATPLNVRVVDFSPGAVGTFQALNLTYPSSTIELVYKPATGAEALDRPIDMGTGLTLTDAHPLALPTDDSGYAVAGFHLRQNGVLSGLSTLAAIQSASDPNTVPSEFYKLPSSFLFIAVGHAQADASLADAHLLAIPVRDPEALRDAGASESPPVE